MLRNQLARLDTPAAHELAAGLHTFVTGGASAGLFDGPTTTQPDGGMVVVSLRDLPDELETIGMLLALDATWRRVSDPGTRRPRIVTVAVLQACMQVATGVSDLIVAGGAESMSQAEFYTHAIRWGVKGAGVELADRLARARVTAGGAGYPVPGGMIETAENLRAEFGISRADQDALAAQSHR